MNRSIVKKELANHLRERGPLILTREQAIKLAHYALIYLDRHMDPKILGTHQTSYDIAMGARPEWDED